MSSQGYDRINLRLCWRAAYLRQSVPSGNGAGVTGRRRDLRRQNGEIDADAVWEPQSQKTKLAIGADAIEFCDPLVYRELFNLCTTQANLDDSLMQQKTCRLCPRVDCGHATVA